MNSVRDFRNNPNPIPFSEFKRLINGIDERRYGDSWVYVGEDNQCPVVGVSTTNRLPAILPGVEAASVYGLSDDLPVAAHVHFIRSGR
jgi:hypothetical protein